MPQGARAARHIQTPTATHIQTPTAAGFALLAKGLAQGCGRLEHLSLQGHCIRNTGCLALARALSSRGAAGLVSVDLRGNQIGDRGALALAEAVSAPPPSAAANDGGDGDGGEGGGGGGAPPRSAGHEPRRGCSRLRLDLTNNAIPPGTVALLTEMSGGLLRCGNA